MLRIALIIELLTFSFADIFWVIINDIIRVIIITSFASFTYIVKEKKNYFKLILHYYNIIEGEGESEMGSGAVRLDMSL